MNFNFIKTNPFSISIFEYIFGEVPLVPGSLFGYILVVINTVLVTTLSVLYFYQIVMSLTSIFSTSKKYPKTEEQASYIFVTSARNEESVIAQLISSIRKLNYPQELITIHVIADNCTDNTKTIAEAMGVEVLVRTSTDNIGKSYALDFYFKKVLTRKKEAAFAGYIIVDTDNVLDVNYLTEINKLYQAQKAEVIAAYRSSTNFGESFWSFGTGYAFLRECSLLHKTREKAGISSYVSGTGFFVSEKKMQEEGGWNQHLLIEDIEFSAMHLLKGGKINYAHDAIFYDEQPNTFRDSWRQRMRWVKGLYQVFLKHTKSLIRALFTGKKTLKQRFSLYESTVFVIPFPGFMLYWYIIYGALALLNLGLTQNIDFYVQTYLFSLFDFVFAFFVFTTTMTYLITFSNWRRINMSSIKKVVLPLFAFFYILTYVPMLLIAPFVKITWKPVKHYGLKK